MARADAVVTLGSTMREEIVARGIDPARVYVVPNCVPVAFTAPLPDRGTARQRLRIPDSAFVLGTVTTINVYEGLDTLVEAIRLVDASLRLVVVGGGPELARLRGLAKPLGDRVLFTGRVPHGAVRDHLAAMDVFCVPPPGNARDCAGSAAEAGGGHGGRASRTRQRPCPLVETVRPGEFGAVAAPDDPLGWADRISALRSAPDDARAMGERARAWVREHRTWAVAAKRYAAIYSRVLGEEATERSPDPGTMNSNYGRWLAWDSAADGQLVGPS